MNNRLRRSKLYLRLTTTFILMMLSLWGIGCSATSRMYGVINNSQKVLASGNTYSVISADSYVLDFVLERPRRAARGDLVLCIPAAFTTSDNKIDGLHLYKGKVHGSVNDKFGGAIMFAGNECKIFATGGGATLKNPAYLEKLRRNGVSLFQQFLLVDNCRASTYKDKTKFQRRAIVEKTDGAMAIIESNSAMPLSDFAKDLVALNARNAIYTDMGAWDEGWYLDAVSGSLRTLGKDRSLTSRQTNWVIFRDRTMQDGPSLQRLML